MSKNNVHYTGVSTRSATQSLQNYTDTCCEKAMIVKFMFVLMTKVCIWDTFLNCMDYYYFFYYLFFGIFFFFFFIIIFYYYDIVVLNDNLLWYVHCYQDTIHVSLFIITYITLCYHVCIKFSGRITRCILFFMKSPLIQ